MNASAVEKTARQTSAAIDRADGASVHGRSTMRQSGTRTIAPHTSEPAAGSIGSIRSKLRLKIAAPA